MVFQHVIIKQADFYAVSKDLSDARLTDMERKTNIKAKFITEGDKISFLRIDLTQDEKVHRWTVTSILADKPEHLPVVKHIGIQRKIRQAPF
jgi:hypothetical protein